MIKANFCLNCLTFGCYEEDVHIYEHSAFKCRNFVDKVEGKVYCMNCEDGGQIIFGEVDEEVFEKIRELYGELPLENNPASAFVLLLAIADHFSTHKRATIEPSRIIPEGLDRELAEKAIREESHDAIIEAWVEVLRDKITKNPLIAPTIQRAIEDLLKLYPDENVIKVCERVKTVLARAKV